MCSKIGEVSSLKREREVQQPTFFTLREVGLLHVRAVDLPSIQIYTKAICRARVAMTLQSFVVAIVHTFWHVAVKKKEERNSMPLVV